VRSFSRIAFFPLFYLLVIASNVAAHPMGNFSISHYSGIRIGRDSVEVRYILDLAEIPTFQEIQQTGLVPKSDDPSAASFLARKSDVLREGLSFEINGQRIPLHIASREIIFPPGAGGLPTMKIGIVYKAKLSVNSTPGAFLLNYRDGNFPGRAGWKEIIAVAQPGAKILNSSVGDTSRSSELNDYPTDLLNSPPQDLEAHVNFTTVAIPAPFASTEVSPRKEQTQRTAEQFPIARSDAADSRQKKTAARSNQIQTIQTSRLSSNHTGSRPSVEISSVQLQANRQATPRNSFTEIMATKQLGFGLVLIAFAVAVGLGAFHALEPGHGKTLVAAYLVGSRGTMKHALLLGLIVTAAHTAGVYLLGVVTLFASHYVVPDQLYPWLGVASGTMIAGLGSVLLLRRYLGKGRFASHHRHHHHQHQHTHHTHEADDHHHHHGRTHHEHDHQVSLRELMTLGISGGIVPCPAALVVLLSAVSMQRTGFGLLLIVAFSVGLAAVLIAIGLLMVYARQFMSRFQADSRVVTYWLPLTSSAFILLFGVALTIQALRSAGIVALHL